MWRGIVGGEGWWGLVEGGGVVGFVGGVVLG